MGASANSVGGDDANSVDSCWQVGTQAESASAAVPMAAAHRAPTDCADRTDMIAFSTQQQTHSRTVGSMNWTKWLVFGLLALPLAGCGSDSSGGATCGDREVEGDEQCDDGNFVLGDGCSPACLIEEGYSCLTEPITICTTVCGDGVTTSDEECDDGNTADGDGCSASCTDEGGGDEETSCTDGTDNDGDGDTDCEDSDCDDDAACDGSPGEETDCADGVDNDSDGRTDCDDTDCSTDDACTGGASEQLCDDGEDNDGDGQSDCEDPDCADDAACGGTCGDGVVDDGEECDDGDANSNSAADACRSDCTAARCGDNVIDTGETCDNGASNGAGGECLSDCSSSPTAGCTGVGYEFLNAVGTMRADGGVDYTVTLDAGVGDSVDPPAGCARDDGNDVRLAYRAAASGLFTVEINADSAQLGTSTYLLDACDGGATLGCTSGFGLDPHGRVFFDALQGEDWFIVVDADAPDLTGSVTVSVRPIDAVLASGESCETDSSSRLCNTGLSCVEGTCVEYEPGVAGLDQACDTAGVDPICDTRLECLGSSETCVPVLGAACRSAFDLESTGTGSLADGLSVALPTGTNFGDASISCGDGGDAAFGTFVAPADGVVTLRASGDAGAFIAVREDCGFPGSEVACGAGSGAEAVTEVAVMEGTEYFVVAGGSSMVDVDLRFLPYVDLGAPCDSELASNRCEPPLVCGALDTCVEPVAASCGDPIDVLMVGSGSGLFEPRGLLVGFNTADGVNEASLACGSGGTDVVASVEGVGNARLRISLSSADAELAYELRRNLCATPAATCDTTRDGTDELVVEVLDGETLFIVVEGIDGDTAGTISVLGEALAGPGQDCSTLDCVSSLGCGSDARVCIPVGLAPGAACGPTTGECADGVDCLEGVCTRTTAVCDPAEPAATCGVGAVCVEFGDAIFCSSTIVGETSLCDDVLVACEDGLTCAIADGESFGSCVPDEGDIGDPCTGSGGCAEGLVCLAESDAIGVCSGTEADFGEACDGDLVSCPTNGICQGYSVDGVGLCNSPRGPGVACFLAEGDAQCASVLTCQDAGDGTGRCQLPDERTPAGENCFANPACEDGFICWPLGPDFSATPSSICERALFAGQACDADPSNGICYPPLTCTDGTCQ